MGKWMLVEVPSYWLTMKCGVDKNVVFLRGLSPVAFQRTDVKTITDYSPLHSHLFVEPCN